MASLRFLRILAGAAALALIVSAGAGPLISWSPLTRVFAAQAVDTGDYYFAPSDVTISVGDTVTWTNSSGEAHTVTGDDGSWGTDDLEPGQSFSRTFTRAGTFTYTCVIHDGQTGTITVR